MNAKVRTLLSEIEAAAELLVAPRILEACEELREELDRPAALWPEGVMEAVAEHVSPSVWNPESQTYKSLNRRITWAMSTWAGRYGPLSPSQREYMSQLLIWAVEKVASEAGGDKRKLYSHLNTEISSLVNHDTVAEGFKRRETRLVDVSRELAEVAA